MGTKPVRIDNRKREKARRRRQTAAARAAVLAAALVLVAVLVVAGIIRHHKKTQTVQNDTSAQTVSQTENGTDTVQGQQTSQTEFLRFILGFRQKQPEKHLQAHRYRV